MQVYKFLFLVFFLGACATGIPIHKYNDHNSAKESFMLCHGYSCTHKSKAGFTPEEWRGVAALFPAASAAAERVAIGRAIALMERHAGAQTGTDEDDAEAVGIKTSPRQMDCIDETINTTAYLNFLQQENLLRFHEVWEPAHRGYILDGTWPHNTAVIRDKENGFLWAVDSFYRANGGEPYIVPRADWLSGWKPPGAKQ